MCKIYGYFILVNLRKQNNLKELYYQLVFLQPQDKPSSRIKKKQIKSSLFVS